MLDWTINDNFGRENINSWGGINTHTGAHVTWNDAATASPANNSKFRVEANAYYAYINMPRLSWNAIYPNIIPGGEQGSVMAKFVMPTSSQTIMATGIYLRAGSPGRYYEITYTSWNNRLRIRVWNTGGFGTGSNIVELNSVAFTPVRGEYYWMRVDFSNSGIYVKCWRADNTPEPSAWTVTTTANNYPINRVGVIGYHEHAANQIFHVSKFMYRHTNGFPNATTSTTVTDTFNDYRRLDLGRATSSHDWHGDHTMTPTFYQGKRSSGNMVTNVSVGTSNAFATIRRGIATNRTDTSWIGPNYDTGNVYLHFSFEDILGRISLLGRVTPGVDAFGNAVTGNSFRVMVYPSTSLVVYKPGAAATYHLHGLNLLPNVEYKMRVQIRPGNRVYAKLWTGTTEPEEWIKLGIVAGLAASGKFGIYTENQATHSGYRLYDYSSSTTTWINRIRAYTTPRTIKFTMGSVNSIRRRTISAPNQKLSMNLISYPLRVRSDASSTSFTAGLSYHSIRRLNIAGYMWVNRVWTKINHVPNMNFVTKKTTTSRRVRKTTIRRDIKISAFFFGRRVRKSTVSRNTKFTIDWNAQVIPDNSAELHAKFGLSHYSVISKGGEANLSTELKLNTESVLGLVDTSDLRARFILDAQIPGFYVVRAFGDIIFGMNEPEALVNYVGTSEAEIKHTLNAYGLVQTIHFGSLDVLASFGAYFKSSLSIVNEMTTNISSSMKALGIRSHLNTFNASMTTGYTLDRPDFEEMFKEIIERRTSFIHYAVTYHHREELIIEYKHKRTMDRASITYFIAYTPTNNEPLLYGASINLWDDGMVLVEIADDVSDGLVQKVQEQFGIETSITRVIPRDIERLSKQAGFVMAEHIVHVDSNNQAGMEINRQGAVRVVTIEE